MTDRLTPADVLRIVADGIWTPRKGATTVYGEEAMRAGIAHRLRDEAARREAEAPGPRTGPNKEGAGVPRFPFPKSIDAPPPPAPPAPEHLARKVAPYLAPDTVGDGGFTHAKPIVRELWAAIEALRAERDALLAEWNAMVVAIGAPKHGTAIAHAAALRARAEAAEARVKSREVADHALVDRYRNPETGAFNFPGDVAAIIRRLDAAEAREKRLFVAGVRIVKAAKHVLALSNPGSPASALHDAVDAMDEALAQGGSDG